MMTIRKCKEFSLYSLKNFDQWLPQKPSKALTVIAYKNLFWLDLLMLLINHQLIEPPTTIHIHQTTDWDRWIQTLGQQSLFQNTSASHVYIHLPLTAKLVDMINQIPQTETINILIQDSSIGKHAKSIQVTNRISAQPIYGQELHTLLNHLYQTQLKHPPTFKLKQEFAHHVRQQNHSASSLIHLLNAIDASVDSLESMLQPSANWPMYACIDCMIFGDLTGLKSQLPPQISIPETHQLLNRCLASITELIDLIESIQQDPSSQDAKIKIIAKWPNRIAKYKQAIKRIPLVTLKKYYQALMEIEYQLKGLRVGDPWHAISLLMLQFANHRSHHS